MLSWSDEADAFSKRSSLAKAGSLLRPGTSFEAQRGSSRRSTEMPISPGGRQSMDAVASPSSSLPKANNLLRGPGNAAEGTIGAEGWWHHMDNSQMNEPPLEDVAKKGQAKTPAFTPQYGATGQQSRSLWADEVPATAARVSSSGGTPYELVPAAAQPPPQLVGDVTMAPASDPAPVGPNGSDGGANMQNTGANGWWNRLDTGILNQPDDAAPLSPPAVRKGEHIMGGSFTPQIDLTAGTHYGSIFGEEQHQRQLPAQETNPLDEMSAGWGPFCGQDGPAVIATAEDDWTGYTSPPTGA